MIKRALTQQRSVYLPKGVCSSKQNSPNLRACIDCYFPHVHHALIFSKKQPPAFQGAFHLVALSSDWCIASKTKNSGEFQWGQFWRSPNLNWIHAELLQISFEQFLALHHSSLSLFFFIAFFFITVCYEKKPILVNAPSSCSSRASASSVATNDTLMMIRSLHSCFHVSTKRSHSLHHCAECCCRSQRSRLPWPAWWKEENYSSVDLFSFLNHFVTCLQKKTLNCSVIFKILRYSSGEHFVLTFNRHFFLYTRFFSAETRTARGKGKMNVRWKTWFSFRSACRISILHVILSHIPFFFSSCHCARLNHPNQ